MLLNLTLVLVLSFIIGTPISKAFAEMSAGLGLVANEYLPKPVNSKQVVFLNVPYMKQKPWLCVPTSSAMILRYFGEKHDPEKLKAAAENYKSKSRRNKQFTYYVDMRRALRKVGKRWHLRDYKKTKSGFQRGWREIKRSLRRGNPVMVDVHLGGGHTFVVIGYNDREKMVYIRDPDVYEGLSRAIPYSDFIKYWHNHRFANSRSAFFSVR